MKIRRAALLAALLSAFAFVFMPLRPASAQGSEPTDDQVNAVAHQLYCPVCESTPLDVCPTQACAQWRATIKEKLAAGWSEQQIKDYFVQQYGERVLANPSTDGFNLVLWVLAPLAILAAAGVGGYYMWTLRKAAPAVAAVPAAPGPEQAPADEYARRLEEELAKRR